MSLRSEYFGNTIAGDFFSLFAGKQLGWGLGREVYACTQDKTVVIKLETASGSFQNIREWELWKDWSYVKDVARWLAPCVDISPCGTVLLQRRTEPVTLDKLPPKLPAFLTDLKVSNFGRLGGKIVCHDYALSITNLSTRVKAVDWSDDAD